jgi:hypothetical protein
MLEDRQTKKTKGFVDNELTLFYIGPLKYHDTFHDGFSTFIPQCSRPVESPLILTFHIYAVNNTYFCKKQCEP